MADSRKIILFIGPSLPDGGLPEGLDAELRPPAAQGDLAEAVLDAPGCVIALVDGIFQGAPAVRHKEILWAISRQATIFGAASMGALRAAELSEDGMHGRGLIYRWYRRFPLAPDDAVAVLHAPAELGAGAITASLIDLRLRFRQARRAGRIPAGTEAALARAAGALHYSGRTLPAVLRKVAGEGIRLSVDDLAPAGPSRKQADALLLLEELRDRQAKDDWPTRPPGPPFVPTDAFLHDLNEAGFSMDSFTGG